MSVLVEVCLSGIESALAAQAGGAQRIELCENLAEGGITPSPGVMTLVREHLTIDVHVLIRPRSGDFCYSDLEFVVMKRDILAAKALGIDGVVFGILNPDGMVDKNRMIDLISLARPMRVTFHRAFDVTRDPLAAIADLISIGIERVLTSGQAKSAWHGRHLLRQLQEQAGDQIMIMAGGGINHENAPRLLAETGLNEIHLGSACTELVVSKMRCRNSDVAMGYSNQSEYMINQVSARRVAAIVNASSNQMQFGI